MGAYPVVLLRCLEHDLRQYPVSKDIWPGATPREAASVSIRRSLFKKWESDQTDDADEACLAKFLQVNNGCRDWKLDIDTLHTWDEELWGEFKSSLDRFFHPGGLPLVGHFGSLLRHGRVGPGASLGAAGGDFYTKFFSSPLTSTRHVLYDEYRRYTRNYPEWSNAEAIRQLDYGDARIVKGNSLSFVPKYTHISRSICTEPSLNMFYQLGLGEVLSARLKEYFGIDLEIQQFHNRELARRGSLDEGYSTLDLESASDSISLRLCEAVLPKWVNDLLKLLRSPTTVIDGHEHELHMVSTMGNGFTFALQTVMFSCMVEASANWHRFNLKYPRVTWDPLVRQKRFHHGNFAVYGDDIICPVILTDRVCRLLRLAGFVVNASKSFVEGPFKESCGADFYFGVNVRGVYLKRLDTYQDFFSAINQLNLFSTRTGIRLPTVIRWLLSRVPWVPVPRWEDDSAGIKVPLSLLRTRTIGEEQSILYSAYRPRGLKIRILDSCIKVPAGLKRRMFNPSGLHISYLQGSINGSTIPVRQKDRDILWIRKRRLVAPNWDAEPTVHPLQGWFCWRRWEYAVYLNL